MRLFRYGIELESLKADHLEMVRLWRNQDYIRQNMEFKGLLSRADQQKWFKQLDPDKNLYWVIRFNDYPIGLVHIKNIDVENGVGEAGVFIGEPSFLQMPQPMLAIMFMMEIAFYGIELKQLKAKIHSDNEVAKRFNLELGYELADGQAVGFQYYTVGQDSFEAATSKLRERSLKMYGSETRFLELYGGTIWADKLSTLDEQALKHFSPLHQV